MANLLELETLVVDAWPAAEAVEHAGWLLRSSGGPTHRGNSVATLAATGGSRLAERIQHAEHWYRERGQRASFQVGPCAAPEGLDAALAERGYVTEGSALFTVASSAEVLAQAEARLAQRAAGWRARIDREPVPEWLELKRSASRFAAQLDSFLGFLERLGSRCRYVLVTSPDGTPAAAVLGIRSGARLGVYAMLTLPAFRGRGAGQAALLGLAQAAASDGVPELYLLVESENLAARRLYASVGFRDVYAYHYRVPAG